MSMSHATLAMWTDNIASKAENAIAATSFDLDQSEDHGRVTEPSIDPPVVERETIAFVDSSST
jgi:hypothetical protein